MMKDDGADLGGEALSPGSDKCLRSRGVEPAGLPDQVVKGAGRMGMNWQGKQAEEAIVAQNARIFRMSTSQAVRVDADAGEHEAMVRFPSRVKVRGQQAQREVSGQPRDCRGIQIGSMSTPVPAPFL